MIFDALIVSDDDQGSADPGSLCFQQLDDLFGILII